MFSSTAGAKKDDQGEQPVVQSMRASAQGPRKNPTREDKKIRGQIARTAEMDLTYGPDRPGRDAGTRWEGLVYDMSVPGYRVIVTWPGDEVGMLSGAFKDEDRAREWARMCQEAGAARVTVIDNGDGKVLSLTASLDIASANDTRPLHSRAAALFLQQQH